MDVLLKTQRFYKSMMPAFWFTIFLGFVNQIAAQFIPQAIQLILDSIIIPKFDPALAEKSKSMLFFLIEDVANVSTQIIIIITAILSLSLVRYICHYVRWNVSHAYSLGCENKMRTAIFNKMLTQNSLILNRYSSGELLNICNQDCVAVKDIFHFSLLIIFDCIISIALASFFLIKIHPLLAIAPVLCGIVMIIIGVSYSRAMHKSFNNVREKSVNLNTVVTENINGVRIVKAFAAEDTEQKKFDEKNEVYKDVYINHNVKNAKYQAAFQGISQFNILISITFAVMLVLDGKIKIGQFATVATYVMMLANPMLSISNFLNMLQHSLVSATRIFTFLDTDNIMKEIPNPIEITAKPDILVRNLGLTIDEKPILKDINLSIPYGKKIGIMGRTGSGKTALLKCLSRFFDATTGEVFINGNNIKFLKIEEVRRQFSWVYQDVFLFSNTVDANIALYDPDADSKDKVRFCAECAQAHNFIMKLSDGYETVVGERGLGLSGGQKQRISIARALYKNAPVILLDDATSALDLNTEAKIFESLKTNYSDFTIIIAAHRASSVMNCDEIIYLENGSIAEHGTHKELMKLKGEYARIFEEQQASHKEVLS